MIGEQLWPGPAVGGLDVVQSIMAVHRRQVRFPRSKKRRIRKKWEKREANWETRPAAFRLGRQLIVHPEIWERLKEGIDDPQGERAFAK